MAINNQWFSDLKKLLIYENVKKKDTINFPTMLIVLDDQKFESLNDMIALNFEYNNAFQIEVIDCQVQTNLLPNLREVLRKMIQHENFINDEYDNQLVLHIISQSNRDVQLIHKLLAEFGDYHEKFKTIKVFIYVVVDCFEIKQQNQDYLVQLTEIIDKYIHKFEIIIMSLNNQHKDGRLISDERLLKLIVGHMLTINQNNFILSNGSTIKNKILLMQEVDNDYKNLINLYCEFIVNAIEQIFEMSNSVSNQDLYNIGTWLKNEVNKRANVINHRLRNDYSLMSLMPQINIKNCDYSIFDTSKSFLIESLFGENIEGLWLSQYESTADHFINSQYHEIERKLKEKICEFPLNSTTITSIKSQLSLLLTNSKMEMNEKYEYYLKFLDEPTSYRRVYKEKHLNRDFLLMDCIESYIQVRTHLLISTKIYNIYVEVDRNLSSLLSEAENNLITLTTLYDELKRLIPVKEEVAFDLVPICKVNETVHQYKDTLERHFLKNVYSDNEMKTLLGETNCHVTSNQKQLEFRIVMNEKSSDTVHGISQRYSLIGLDDLEVMRV